MNNRQLTIFRTVCEEGSMTKAAEKLYMTQPAVSQTIKELEQESGVCFLERRRRAAGFYISMHAISLDCIRIWNSI